MADVMQVISKGMRHRKVGSHELNLESSRSHSIMTVYCESTASGQELPSQLFGKISFVDLAGSERLKDSKSCGETLKETSSINRSLFTLGKVSEPPEALITCLYNTGVITLRYARSLAWPFCSSTLASSPWLPSLGFLPLASFAVVASVGGCG